MVADIGAQAAADKLTLKSQLDGLFAEVESLKAERAKSQELEQQHTECLAKANAREKSLQNRLHNAIEALRSKHSVLHLLRYDRSFLLIF
jgi:hypothetical protein